jgi:sortase (surface protein transpeptidase)
MIQPQLPPPRGGRWRLWAAAATVLLIGAAVLVAGGIRGNDDALSAPPTTASEPAAATAADSEAAAASSEPASPGVAAPRIRQDDEAPAPVVEAPAPVVEAPAPVPPADRSAPLELRIPAIGVSTSMTELGLNPDNTVEVPTDFQQAGWFAPGPSPGQPGSAVILGHVDSYRGPAVFFRLRSLHPGDAVEVRLADGAVAHFAVTAVETYLKDQFPAERVYGPHGNSALQLVTCGGEFDRQARSYLSNIVAYTSLVAVTPAP